MEKIFDMIGVGFGPANLALAICLEEMGSTLETQYIDSSSDLIWQSQMLLPGSDIQNNPLRDLVTPRNPKSHFGFINYLKETRKLFEYLNTPNHYPLRSEYAQYIKWASNHFKQKIKKNTRVSNIEPIKIKDKPAWKVSYVNGTHSITRSIVLGTGRTPNIPEVFRPHIGSKIFHLNNYSSRIREIPDSVKKIGVLGASQSAVEMCLDLLARFPEKEIFSIHRSFGFRLKDTSPFSDRVYLPEFVDYYHNLPDSGKQNLNSQLRATNYSSADSDVINALYMKQHEEKLQGNNRFKIMNNTEIKSIRKTESNGYELHSYEVNTQESDTINLDALVLATGFLDLSSGPKGELSPPLLAPISDLFEKDEHGVITVTRDYRVNTNHTECAPIFLNGLCESSHGLGDAGSFSLLSLRSEQLAKALLFELNPSFEAAS